jgi:hypothetical protein
MWPHLDEFFKGEWMAELNKVEIYRLLYRLNRSFTFVVEHLKELEPMRMIAAKDMKMFQASVQELQSEINDMVLDSLQPIEMHDSARFDRIRAAREKELRDPDDVFLLAEERRKEIERQKKKQQKKKQQKHSALHPKKVKG